jgi:adenylate cyclase
MSRPRLQLRLRPTLLVATAALVVATTTAGGAIFQYYAGAMVERLLERQLDTVAGGAAVQVEALFDDATRTLRELRHSAELNLLPLDDPAALGRRFAERLREDARLAWISHGDLVRDRFVGATRLADGAILVNWSQPDIAGGVPAEQIALADGGWRAAGLPHKKPYSVVGQSWFKDAIAADGLRVSTPYTFAEGRTGVTLALRHSDPSGKPQGVFTVDFFLADLSRGLAGLTEGGRNDAVLLGVDGLVLANAGAERPPDLAGAASAFYGQHRGTIDGLAQGEGLLLETVATAVPYRVALRRLAVDSGAIVLALFEPTQVLLAPVREVRLHVIGLTLAAMALGLLGAFLLATRVTRPLQMLAAETERIREFDLERPVETSAWIADVAGLARAMERMRIGVRTFGLYVPKDLVRRLMEAGGEPSLGGEHRELTIMFSDIAGFTSQSEQTPPAQLMRRISMYFDAMAEAIHAHRGVIDKFIGDAVMALWNAPAHDPEHARNACRAVLACRAANLRLNATLAARGLPPFSTRFGLHTGEAVVGNLGGADRIQYTALGANVNLAARLEALNKHYRTTILVSEDTRRRAGDGFLFRFVAHAQPVGTSRPIGLCELLGASDDAEAGDLADLCARWDGALAYLAAGNFADALRRFGAIAAARPQDGLAEHYQQRLQDHLARRPGTPWEAVDRFDQK